MSSFVALLFVYSLVSRRLESTVITAPLLFACAGAALLLVGPSEVAVDAQRNVSLHLAEAGLVLLLFTDASRTDLKFLRGIWSLPARLLSGGMLLTIGLGALAALVLFRQLTLWEAGILAAILAPTDAGLGQVIVTNEHVPVRVRQALNVEAGLNDGLAVPFLLFLIALAAPSDADGGSLGRFVAEQLGIGILIGLTVGLVGGAAIGIAQRRGWIAAASMGIAVVSLPIACAIASEALGASMFIAAFVAGAGVQWGFRQAGAHSVEFAEEWGQILNLFVFLLFGVLVARDWRQFSTSHVLYAIASLTVVRMLPVALALIGTRLHASTVLFMGWFGPRGLASIVLGLVYLERTEHLPPEPDIRLAVMATVAISIVAHGLSATPAIGWYARCVQRLPADAPERSEAAVSS